MSKYYLSILLLLGILFSSSLYSQIQNDSDFSTQCGTTELHERLRLQVELINTSNFRSEPSWFLNSSYGSSCDNDCVITSPPAGMGTTYKLPVVFTVSTTSCTRVLPTLSEIESTLNKMNDFYACQGIPVEFYRSKVWNGAPTTGDNSTNFQDLGCTYDSNTAPYIDSVINIYIFDDTGNGTGCNGFAYLPFNANSARLAVMSRRCFNNYAYMDGSIDCNDPSLGLSVVMIHEMGHYLGLYHTHQGGDECPDGSNACSAGDFIADTDADPRLNSDCAIRNGGSCTDIDISGCTSPCATDYPDNASSLNIIDNIMSYNNWGSCRKNFTACQKAKIVDALLCARGPQLCQRNTNAEFTDGNSTLYEICVGDAAPTFTASSNFNWHDGIGVGTNILTQNSNTFTPTIGNAVGQLENMIPGTYTWYLGDVNEINNNCRSQITIIVIANAGIGTSNQMTAITLSGNSTANLNSNTTILGENELIGWWLSQDNPASNGITNQIELDNTIQNATIGGNITGNPINHIFPSTNGTLLTELPLSIDCSLLNPDKTYYATPVVAKYFAGIPTEMCSAINGTLKNITFNGFPGKYTSINANSISCTPLNPPSSPTYTLTVVISNYSGNTSNHRLLFRDSGLGGNTLKSKTISGNGTYTYTEVDFPNFDPGKAANNGLTLISWEQGGSGMSSGNISATLDIIYPGLDPIQFPSLEYSSCVFGTPVIINCEAITCELVLTNTSQSACNDNNTPMDPSDDWFSMNFNAANSTSGASNMFEVVMNTNNDGSGGTVIGVSTYGTAISIDNNKSFKTGNATTYSLLVRDKDDNSCFQNYLTSPVASCSNFCALNQSGLIINSCSDNGTPIDPADDFYTFTLNPTGVNLGNAYTVSSNGFVIPGISYGSNQIIGGDIPISLGVSSITITDNENGCTLTETVTPPENCSNSCTINATGLITSSCNDNGTPMNPSDDYFTFSINPTGTNIGNTYSISFNGNTIPNISYGSIKTINENQLISNGDITLIVTDEENGCTMNENISAPESCSSTCTITTSGLIVTECDDNSTSLDPSDDFYSFSINPNGTNIGNSYNVSGDFTINNLTYGSIQLVGDDLLTSSGIKTITITDIQNGCTISETVVPPASCSSTCTITESGVNISKCNDNGTPIDPSDDFFTFTVNPSGDNIGTSYNILGSGINMTNVSYGSNQMIGGEFLISNGSLNITITDTENGCMFNETIGAPISCSNNCLISSSGLNISECNDNGTPTDPSDDYFTFTVNPSGDNIGTSYNITGSGINMTNISYGSDQMIGGEYLISVGNVAITVTDNKNGCTLNETVTAPPSCSNESNECTLTSLELLIWDCDDNDTSLDPNDDLYSISVNPTGDNLGQNFTVSSNEFDTENGQYGTIKYIKNIQINTGEFEITVTDQEKGCTLTAMIRPPLTCSDECQFTDLGLTISECNDNNTPKNAEDDYYSFILNPTGMNLGNSYTISEINNTISTTKNYGADQLIDDNILISLGDLNITISDNTNECSMDVTVEAPEICSDTTTQTITVELEKEIALYPNPTTGLIYFTYSGKEELKFTTYTCTGNKIQDIGLESNNNNSFLNITNFPEGVYFIKIAASNGESTIKRFVLMR